LALPGVLIARANPVGRTGTLPIRDRHRSGIAAACADDLIMVSLISVSGTEPTLFFNVIDTKDRRLFG
jgi:hypothetical protein